MVAGDLQYFDRSEFIRDGEQWFDLMSDKLLYAVDLLRYRWTEYRQSDARIVISAHPLALGRRYGPDVVSDHNVDKWGKVYAMDVMPDYILTAEDVAAFKHLAIDSGITAIGFYRDWMPSPGFHLGMRPGRKYGEPATWGAVLHDGRQVYTSWPEATEGMA